MKRIINSHFEFEITWKEDGGKSIITIDTTHTIKFIAEPFNEEKFNALVEKRLEEILIQYGKDEDHEFTLLNSKYDPEEPPILMDYSCEYINIGINGCNNGFQTLFQEIGVKYLRYVLIIGMSKLILNFTQVGGTKAVKMLRESSFPIDLFLDDYHHLTLGLVVMDEYDEEPQEEEIP